MSKPISKVRRQPASRSGSTASSLQDADALWIFQRFFQPMAGTGNPRTTSLSSANKREAADLIAYVQLSQQWTPRPIQDDREQKRAMSVVEKLAVREEGSLSPREQAYLDAAAAFLEAYDAKHSTIARTKGSVTHRLRYVVEQAGLSVTELGRIVGSQVAASYLLSGSRTPSKSQIPKLAAYFKVDAGYFL